MKMDYKAIAIGALVLSMVLALVAKGHNERIYALEDKIEILINQPKQQ